MAAYNFQPADVLDFSRGMTDDYVNGPVNAAQELTNFIILNNKSIKTRPGTELDSETDPQVPNGSQRVQTLISYANSDKLFVHAVNKIFYRNPTNYATLTGPTGNQAFNTATANTYLATTQWNRHLICTADSYDKPVKIYKDSSSNYQLRTAGLPALASSPSPSGTAGAQSFIYAFVHKYTYTVNDQTFIDFGPVTQVQISNINAPNVNNVTISSIPVLANAAGDNYDTSNVKIEIYRTINGGNEFYRVSEVTNGTTSYVDSMSDTTLQNNEPIYTAGGVPDNDPPPLSKFCHTVNGFTYFAHFKVGSEIFPNKIRQSQKDDPDSVPGSFEDELEDEISGLSSVQDIPIVGCRKHIYRIDGFFDEVGRGGMTHRRISDHAGCLSHESFVQAEGGLYWFGQDGIYFTEGFRVQKVTDHLNARYKAMIETLAGKTQKIKGVYNEFTRMIHWTVSFEEKASGLEECDSIWTIDLQWGVSENMSCHIWEGESTFFPTSLVVHNKTLYRGDKFGYVVKFNDALPYDIKIVPATAPSTWYKETIIWRYKSVATNFGTSFARKVANKILLSSRNETNVSIAITAINDDGKITRQLTPIRWRKNFTWGDEEFIWGNEDFVWYYGGTIEVDRRFPAGGYRFNYLQIDITNDFTNIVNSDLMGNAIVNAGLDTATLVDSVNGDWPSQAIDYYLYLEHDNYTRGYKVLVRSNDTLTVEDIGNTLISGTWKWQLKGYRKGEVLNLVGYSISWAPVTRSHDTFNTGEDGRLSGT